MKPIGPEGTIVSLIVLGGTVFHPIHPITLETVQGVSLNGLIQVRTLAPIYCPTVRIMLKDVRPPIPLVLLVR